MICCEMLYKGREVTCDGLALQSGRVAVLGAVRCNGS